MQKKSLGQVFLKDQNILQKIIKSAAVSPLDTVLEIGCGAGVLSAELAKLVQQLYIVEIDSFFLEKTKEKLAGAQNVEYFLADVLKFNFSQLPNNLKIIANIPYYISAKIIKLVITHHTQIEAAYLMVQKEFAQKIIAQPNTEHYCSLGIYTNFYLESSSLFDVSKNSFSPVPKVDSAIICLKPRPQPLYDVNPDKFFAMVRSAFWGRRKNLLNCLLNSPYLKTDPAIKAAPFLIANPNIRGETLSTEQFYQLYLQIEPLLSSVLK